MGSSTGDGSCAANRALSIAWDDIPKIGLNGHLRPS